MDKKSFTESKRLSPPIAGLLGSGPVNRPYEWLDGSDTLFICIHGYLGSPDSFRPLALRLSRRGFDCAAIQLPGHGGSGRDFARARAPDWTQHVRSEIDRLRPGYKRVILVGHSLGCLLALNDTADRTAAAATRSPGSAADDRRAAPRLTPCPIDGFILYCTPLRLRFRPFGFGIAASLYTTPPERDTAETAAYRLSYGLGRLLMNPFALLPPANEMIGVMRQTREKLPRITAPTLIIQSLRDETASPASAREIASSIGGYVHVCWLRRSRHAWIEPDEQLLVDAEIDRFLAMVLRP